MHSVFLQSSASSAAVVRTTPTKSVPFDSWPEAFKYYARRRARPGDRGLGDVLERSFGKFGRLFKRFYKRVTGHECNCQERREWLNARYPFTAENTVDRVGDTGV